MIKDDPTCECDAFEQEPMEMSVTCPYHGQEALNNKTGYYAPSNSGKAFIDKLRN